MCVCSIEPKLKLLRPGQPALIEEEDEVFVLLLPPLCSWHSNGLAKCVSVCPCVKRRPPVEKKRGKGGSKKRRRKTEKGKSKS